VRRSIRRKRKGGEGGENGNSEKNRESGKGKREGV